LTRQSIIFKKMDARIKSAHDESNSIKNRKDSRYPV